MGVAGGRDSGADVQELSNSTFGQMPDNAVQKHAIGQSDVLKQRKLHQCPPAELTVNSPVGGTAKQAVIDARNARSEQIDDRSCKRMCICLWHVRPFLPP